MRLLLSITLSIFVMYPLNSFGRTLFITGKIEPSLKLVSYGRPKLGEASISIYYDGSQRERRCGKPSNRTFAVPKALKGMLCYDHDYGRIGDSRTNARLEIRSPGYKKHSRNLASLQYDEKGTAYVDIGIVKLEASELPTIEQIIYSQVDDCYHFEITLHNPLKRTFLIREARIEAFKPGSDFNCCCPPNAIFKVGNTLEIVAGGKNRRLTEGDFRELKRVSDNTVKANGFIEVDGCNDSVALGLRLPTSFILPANRYIAVHVILPKSFNIADSRLLFAEPMSKNNETILLQSFKEVLELESFSLYTFAFLTLKEDELEILGSYPDDSYPDDIDDWESKSWRINTALQEDSSNSNSTQK